MQDVVIVGGGPGGVATSLFLDQRGIGSTLVEKDSFPRYHIGESLTGECGQCLRLLGLEQMMKEVSHPVKHGVKVFGPEGKNSFYVPVMARTADGLADASTWQVRRSDFDQMLLDAASSRGVEMVQGQATEVLQDSQGGVCGVRVRTNGQTRDISSRVLVDASGQSSFLSTNGVCGSRERGRYDKQIAIFSQVKGAIREGDRPDDTLIFYRKKNHWAWFIPLDQETVSVGVTTPAEYFTERQESKHDFLVRELGSLNPELTRRIPASCELTEEVRGISNYSYHVRSFTGPGYLCVGDSHRFVDPIFSFGVYFSVKEAEFASQAIADYLQDRLSGQNPFLDYQDRCERGQDTIQTLIDAFWDHPLAFAVFAHTRYREDFVDLFAGRVYGEQESPGLQSLRLLNSQTAMSQ